MVKVVSDRIKCNESSFDVLNDVLNSLRFKGSIFFQSELASPWGMSLSKYDNPRFHIAVDGNCFVGVQGLSEPAIQMKHMDIVMLPGGDKHWIADQPGRKLETSERAGAACQLGTPLFQNGTITNKLICAIVEYDKDLSHPILNSLPSILHFSNISLSDPVWMTVVLIDSIMKKEQSNNSVVIDRLAELLFIQLLKKHVLECEDTTKFFAALSDKRIHKTLELIHNQPGDEWTLDLLVEKVNMSRATLVRQFKKTVGMPPMMYLFEWRMIKAHNLIKNSNKTLEQISEDVGFSSARTLSKAFKKTYGKTPSQLRKTLG
jgi:AraC-like DNA-binding protein